MANRQGRIKAIIAKDIADIVREEIKKPGLGIVCVNDVDVTSDYSLATVYVSFLDGKYTHQKIAELQKTEGFVRSSLAKKIDLYKVPKVHFVLDETSLAAARIDAVLEKEEAQIAAFPKQNEEK